MEKNNEIKEMSEIFQYKDKEYLLVFNLNVLQAVQEEYGSYDKWQALVYPENKKECNIKALLFAFKEMINEGIDIKNEENNENTPYFTEKHIGRMLTALGLEKMQDKLLKTVTKSVKSKNEESKN